MNQNDQQRPTPETDTASDKHPSWPATATSFARKLERERDEAREQLEAMREAFNAAKAFIDCHVADPDITAEMVQTYAAYQDALAKLQPFLKP